MISSPSSSPNDEDRNWFHPSLCLSGLPPCRSLPLVTPARRNLNPSPDRPDQRPDQRPDHSKTHHLTQEGSHVSPRHWPLRSQNRSAARRRKERRPSHRPH